MARAVAEAAAAALALAFAFGGCAASRSEAPDRSRAGAPPNIVLFTSDDHGRRDLGCYGSRVARTPVLDSLAASGIVFDNAYTVTAICSPSRAALLTGLYPHTSGCFGMKPCRDDIVPLTARLEEAGYVCALVGKRHIAPWDAFRFAFSPTDPKQEEGGRVITAYAEDVRAFFDWRRTAGRDGPFFLMINFHDPHRPFREQFVDAGAAPFDSIDVPPWLPDLPEVRDELRMYLQYIERLDRGIGLCLAEMRAAGVAEETIVFYTSDHGAAFPFAKTTLYEAGISVPLVASAPGRVDPGTRTDALVSFVDFAPTLLELAGAPVPAELEGISFASALGGANSGGAPDASALAGPSRDAGRSQAGAGPRECVFGTQTDDLFQPSYPMRSVRCGSWKYIFNVPEHADAVSASASSGRSWNAMVTAAKSDPAIASRVALYQERLREELFDLAADPHELRNLAPEPAHSAQLDDLRRRLVEHMDAIGDPFLAVIPFASGAQRARAQAAYYAYLAYDAERAKRPHNAAMRESQSSRDDD